MKKIVLAGIFILKSVEGSVSTESCLDRLESFSTYVATPLRYRTNPLSRDEALLLNQIKKLRALSITIDIPWSEKELVLDEIISSFHLKSQQTGGEKRGALLLAEARLAGLRLRLKKNLMDHEDEEALNEILLVWKAHRYLTARPHLGIYLEDLPYFFLRPNPIDRNEAYSLRHGLKIRDLRVPHLRVFAGARRKNDKVEFHSIRIENRHRESCSREVTGPLGCAMN
jgi:hypothetical protein